MEMKGKGSRWPTSDPQQLPELMNAEVLAENLIFTDCKPFQKWKREGRKLFGLCTRWSITACNPIRQRSRPLLYSTFLYGKAKLLSPDKFGASDASPGARWEHSHACPQNVLAKVTVHSYLVDI
jgi:hypothetical protein